MNQYIRHSLFTFFVGCTLLLTGCETLYFEAMEVLGYQKRHLLVEKVEAARQSQVQTQSQFNSALEKLQVLIHFKGGDLELAYNKAKTEYEDSFDTAKQLTDSINTMDMVANALFNEWKTEINQISAITLRQESQKKLNQTQTRYKGMLLSIRRTEEKIAPVLTGMKDNMLFLKHNLNARAITAMQGEFNNLDTNINALLKEMNLSIKESDRFIRSLTADNQLINNNKPSTSGSTDISIKLF